MAISPPLGQRQSEGYGGRSQNVFGIFITTLSQLHDIRCAVPLLLYFALRLSIIALYIASVDVPLSSFWALFIEGISGEDVSHYPSHLILMPAILGRFDIILDIFVSVLFQGATIALIAAAFLKKSVSLGGGFSTAARVYRHMIAVMFIVSLVLFVCLNLPRFFAADIWGVARIGVIGLALVLGLTAQALFLYALPAVVLGRRTAFGAIAASVRLARSSAATTFLLVAIPFVLTVPTLLLGFKAELIALRISPDFLLFNQIVAEIMQLIATFLIIGGATIVLVRHGGDVRRSA